MSDHPVDLDVLADDPPTEIPADTTPVKPITYLNVDPNNDQRVLGALRYDQRPEDLDPTRYIEASDEQLAAVSQIGIHYIEEDGTVRTEPVPPPPLRKYDARTFVKEARTTNGTPTTVTFPVADNTGYIGTVYILGVQDVSPFNRLSARKAVMVARRTGNAVLDGQADLHPPFQRGASAWTVVLGVNGSDVTVTLTGVAGVNIDWTLWGEFFRFNKDGLAD